jgi:hypothetical protein
MFVEHNGVMSPKTELQPMEFRYETGCVYGLPHKAEHKYEHGVVCIDGCHSVVTTFISEDHEVRKG